MQKFTLLKRLVSSLFLLVSADYGFATTNPAQAVLPATPNYQYVFDINALPEISIEVSKEQWNVLLSSTQNDRPKAQVTSFTFTKNGAAETINNLGLKISGNTSFVNPEVGRSHCTNCADWVQANFNFDFAAFEKNQTFRGLTGMKLKRFRDDSTYVREVLANDIMQRFGIFTVHYSTYARVYVRVTGDSQRAYFGVYRMNEDVNEVEYLTNRFGADNDAGFLWKMSNSKAPNCSGQANLKPITIDSTKMSRDDCTYEFKGKKAVFDAAKVSFVAFLDAINTKSDADFKIYADEKINTELLLKGMAAEAILGQWDGMSANFNNYYMYFDEAGVMQFVPFDMDNTFGTSSAIIGDSGSADLLNWGSNVLVKKMLSIPEYKAQYIAYLNEMVNNSELFNETRAVNWIVARHNLIKNVLSNATGDNGSYKDAPASWGNKPNYRIFNLNTGDSFYAAKKAAVRAVNTVPTGFSKTFNQLNFRGTPNSWGTTPMTLVGNNTWQVQVTFAAEVNPRFKFDVSTNWTDNYGDTNADKTLEKSGGDIKVVGNKSYLITVNDITKKYTITDANVPNQAPIARAGVDQTVLVNSLVRFDGTGSSDADGTIVNYSWSNDIVNPSDDIAYQEPGVYTVTLTVTDDDGDSATDEVVITVVDNFPPVANAGADITVVKGQTFSLNGSASTDSNGSIQAYDWSNGMTSAVVSTTIFEVGTYTFTLTVTDDQGATATDSVVVTVKPENVPVFNKTFDQLNFRGTANSWAATPMTLIANNTWQIEINFAAEVNPRFKFDVSNNWSNNYGDTNADKILEKSGGDIKVVGNKSYLITVNDLSKKYTIVETNVTTPVNKAPVANAGADINVVVGQSFTLNGSASSDSDGSIQAFNWSNGAITAVASTSIAQAGTYTYTLTVTDNEGATGTDTVVVNVSEPSVGASVNFTCNNATTTSGQSIYAVGSVTELGGWSTSKAIKLSASSSSVWKGIITLPVSTAVQWKCIKINGNTVVWESGGNTVFTTPASGTASTTGSF